MLHLLGRTHTHTGNPSRTHTLRKIQLIAAEDSIKKLSAKGFECSLLN